MYEFDWSSIPGALPILADGMLVTLEITAMRHPRRHRLGHAAGAGPALRQPRRWPGSPPAT